MQNKKLTEEDVICNAIDTRTFQASADWLNEKLPVDYQITRQSIHNWVVGKHQPQDEFIRALIMFYPETDPRFALGKNLTEMRLARMKAVS